MRCLQPPLDAVPEGDWFCPRCAARQGLAALPADEEAVEDGVEVEDEADEIEAEMDDVEEVDGADARRSTPPALVKLGSRRRGAAGQPSAEPAFSAAAAFGGARPGAVFKMGEQGLGYYRDGPGGDGESAKPLPEGWVSGQTPEGYVYYWHTPTSTSSWERPTGPSR